jgi:sulfoxide reductase heme-binding subunit YedZ
MEMRARFTRSRRLVVQPEPAGGWATATLLGASLLVVIVVVGATLSGRSPSPITWYLARASGMTLYLLLWLSTLLGLGLTTTLLDRFGGRGVIYSLHGYATALAYGFLALHLLSLAADQRVPFGPAALLVPFASPWREPWTGFGVLAGELFIAIGASFSLRRFTGYRFWRALHWLTFPVFGLGLAHGIGAGTDSETVWAQTVYLFTALAVVWLTGYRILRGPSRVQPPHVAARPAFDRLGS